MSIKNLLKPVASDFSGVRSNRFISCGLVVLLHLGVLFVIIEHKLIRELPLSHEAPLNVYFLKAPEVLPARIPLPIHLEMPVRQAASKRVLLNDLKTVAPVETAVTNESSVAVPTPIKQDTPHLVLNDVLQSAKLMDRNRQRTEIERLHDEERTSNSLDERLGRGVEHAARKDCRTAYVSPTFNLLAVIPLAIDTLTDTGCKW
jgi:hypothetical protein